MPWRVVLKWRISNPAGFEGGTKVYVNTIDPWELRRRAVAALLELRAGGAWPPASASVTNASPRMRSCATRTAMPRPGEPLAAFPFEALRRTPDIEAPGLVAVDAADRLILDESASARADAVAGELVVIGDAYGALALGAAWDLAARDRRGTGRVRVHQDALMGERAIAANAAGLGLADVIAPSPALDAALVTGARVVLMRLPRSLDALRDIAGLVAERAAPDVAVFAGGRIKHMTRAMNDVLGAFFARRRDACAAEVARAHRTLRPRRSGTHAGRSTYRRPRAARLRRHVRRREHRCRHPVAPPHLPDVLPGGGPNDPWLDLACGNGIIGAWLATRHPSSFVVSSDPSSSAVVGRARRCGRIVSRTACALSRADALEERPDASASLITLNPPFHSGAAVTDQIAPRLFADAARVLRPGGELWCVWNSPLRYRAALERIVGPTRQVARDPRFTVTVTTRR
jgi:16S rRNA (guanine1207-N2)-methyltransferase